MKRMKKSLSLLFVVMMCFILCVNAVASSQDIYDAVESMKDNVDITIFSTSDENADSFDQMIVYDKVSNTFTHYVVYPAFNSSGYLLITEEDPDKITSLYKLWQANRSAAELWIFKDASDVMKLNGCSVVMKFVTTLDKTADNYLVTYALKIDDKFKVTILENIYTDEYEPVKLQSANEDETYSGTKTTDKNNLSGKPRMGVNASTMKDTGGRLPRGVYIAEVEKDSPAEKGGLHVGDIIVEMNGEVIKNVSEEAAILESLKEGDTVKLVVFRSSRVDASTGQISTDGEYLELRVKLSVLE